MPNANVRVQMRTKGSAGGQKIVFYTPARHKRVGVVNGAELDSTGCPAVGGKIFMGDFGYYNPTTGKVKHLKTFKLAKKLEATDTSIYFYGGDFDHVLTTGTVLMVAPATGATTGAGVAIASVEVTTLSGVEGNVYKGTITAGAFSATDVAANTIFVEADKAHATDSVPLVPTINCIFAFDIYIDFPYATAITDWGKATYTTGLYYHETLYKASVKIPAYVEALNKLSNNATLFEL
jgi:hypothetical protein